MKLLQKRKLWVTTSVITGVLLGVLVAGGQVANYFSGAINSFLNASTSIVQNYNGIMNISWKDCSFNVNTLLPIVKTGE